MADDPFPAKFIGEAKASYEHSNIKKHLVLEFRSDTYEICKPKREPTKEHFWSKERVWLVHYKDEGEPDIRLLNP